MLRLSWMEKDQRTTDQTAHIVMSSRQMWHARGTKGTRYRISEAENPNRSAVNCDDNGGPRRDRTDDPRIKSPLLYRLS
jgi:hypothetical protein